MPGSPAHPSSQTEPPPNRDRQRVHPKRSAQDETLASLSGLKLTHPERVIDPSSGLTKLDLAKYYASAAPLMLPGLQRRPISLVRATDGISGEIFFQKHGDVAGVKQLDPALDPGHDPLLEVSTARALLAAVQMNTIEFHTWNATTRAIEKPDRMTFDLDPGDGVEWKAMIEAARLVKALLDELSLESCLKTSGGKGLHVIVPIAPKIEWAGVRSLSQAIVQHLAETLPDHFVARSGPRNRVGKIFVDYLRNGRSATTVAAWSARARPGLGVSVPVEWDELETLTSGSHWTLRNIAERFDLGDVWGEAGTRKQSLAAALKALGLSGAAS